MHRLADPDVFERVPVKWRGVASVAFGMACAAVAIGLRSAVDLAAPGAGPFALVYPTVLIATLYGRLPGGLTALAISFLWMWLVVYAPTAAVDDGPSDVTSRLLLNGICALVIVLFGEAFRRATFQARARRDEELAVSRRLMGELAHRTKNNLAMVVSLLELQKRRTTSEEIVAALDTAIGQIHSFADTYQHLSLEGNEQTAVMAGGYLTGLSEKLARSFFGDQIQVRSAIEDVKLTSSVAVALGLYLNEALTNAAKYAFDESSAGTIDIRLVSQGSGWRLEIVDDGVGHAAATGLSRGNGQGTDLFTLFARQAGAHHRVEFPGQGRKLVLVSEGRPARV